MDDDGVVGYRLFEDVKNNKKFDMFINLEEKSTINAENLLVLSIYHEDFREKHLHENGYLTLNIFLKDGTHEELILLSPPASQERLDAYNKNKKLYTAST